MANDILVKVGADISDFSSKMANVSKTLSNAGKNMSDMGRNLSNIGTKLTNKITKPALAAATAVGGITLAKGFQRLTGIDTARAKLGALGHDAKNVDLIMTNALDAVRGTAYGLDEAATAAASAVAAGIKPGKELTKYLSLMGDTAAIAGTDFNEMASIFNKVQTAQRAYTGDLNMLADRGIPIYQWLAEEAGTSAEAIRDMASRGEVSAEMFRQAIDKNIGGAAKTIGEQSFMASLKNIGADIARIGANFLDAGGEGEGFFSTLKPLMTEFREYLSTLEDKAAELGKKFGETFVNFIETLRNLKSSYDNLNPSIQNVIKYVTIFGSIFLVALGPILKFIAFIPRIVSGFSAIITGAKLLGTAIAGINLPITLIVAAIIGLAIIIYKYWDEIKAFTIETWNAIKEFFSELWESIKEIFTAVWDPIKEAWSVTVEWLQELWNGIGEFFSELWEGVTEVFTSFVDGMKEIFSPITEFFSEILGTVSEVFTENWNVLTEFLSETWENIKTIASAAWELIKNVILGPILLMINLMTGDMDELNANLQAIWGNIKDAAGRIWGALKDQVSKLMESLGEILSNIWDGMKRVASIAWEGMKSAASKIWNGIKSLGSEIWNGIKETVSDLANKAKEGAIKAWNTLKEKTSEAFNKVVDFIKDPLENIDLFSIGKDIIQGLINGIGSMAEAVWDKAKSIGNSIADGIKGVLGIKSPSRVMMSLGKWTSLGLAEGIEDYAKYVDKASDRLAESAVPDVSSVDMSYNTPAGVRGTLASAVRGTVDVNNSDDRLINAIMSLERRLSNLEVVMDGEKVGRIVRPHVNKGNALDATVRRYFD